MDPGAAIVTCPSQQRQVFDHSPNKNAMHTTCVTDAFKTVSIHSPQFLTAKTTGVYTGVATL